MLHTHSQQKNKKKRQRRKKAPGRSDMWYPHNTLRSKFEQNIFTSMCVIISYDEEGNTAVWFTYYTAHKKRQLYDMRIYDVMGYNKLWGEITQHPHQKTEPHCRSRGGRGGAVKHLVLERC